MTHTALITGAASGIGAACAAAIAALPDTRLALADIDAGTLARTAEKLGSDRCLTLAFDVADPAGWADAEAQIKARFGRIDWAVVNAGVADAAPIAEMSFDAWRRVLSTNLDGAFLTLQTTMRLMTNSGAVVAIASAAGVKAEPGIAAYAASKAGLLQLARVAAKEGAANQIRVNAIAPGGVKTPIWRAVPMFAELVEKTGSEDGAYAEMAKFATPLGRYAEADEIAALALNLLRDTAPVTGATIIVDGGYTL